MKAGEENKSETLHQKREKRSWVKRNEGLNKECDGSRKMGEKITNWKCLKE